MIALAGGTLLCGVAGRPSFAVEWSDLAGLCPDVRLVMPCGFDLAAARTDARRHVASIRAVTPPAIRSARAAAVDATTPFSRPGLRDPGGVELLAALLPPVL